MSRKSKPKPKLKLSKAQEQVKKDIAEREARLRAKQEEVLKEGEELSMLKRKTIMETVTSFNLQAAELDAFVSAFDGILQRGEIALAILNAAASKKVDMGGFQVKLARMGILA